MTLNANHEPLEKPPIQVPVGDFGIAIVILRSDGVLNAVHAPDQVVPAEDASPAAAQSLLKTAA